MPSEFGATPWGRSWTRTVECTTASGPNPLLPKARGIARNQNACLTTEVGVLTAKVVVSGAESTVRIELPPWSAETGAEADRLIAKSLSANPGLAAGDLPDSLAAEFTAAGITVAVPLGDQVATCDCRTRKRPCAHILATLYALSMRVDERPMLAVELRTDRPAMIEEADPDWLPLTDMDPATFYG